MKKEELIETLREVYQDYKFDTEVEKCIILYPLSIQFDKNGEMGVLKVHQPTPTEVEMYLDVVQDCKSEMFLNFEKINKYITKLNAERKVEREAEEKEAREIEHKRIRNRILNGFKLNQTCTLELKNIAAQVNESPYLIESILEELVNEKLIDTEMQGPKRVFRFKKIESPTP